MLNVGGSSSFLLFFFVVVVVVVVVVVFFVVVVGVWSINSGSVCVGYELFWGRGVAPVMVFLSVVR